MYGDIQNEDNPLANFADETGIAFGLRGGHYFSPILSAHFQLINAQFKGFKNSSNIGFESGLLEFQFGVTANVSNLLFGEKDRRISFYGFTGVSPLYFKSRVWQTETGKLLTNYGYSNSEEITNSGRQFGLAFPLGGGMALRLQDNWYLNLETAIRFSTSDLLDGYDRGTNHDAYYYTSLGISYNFETKARGKKVESSAEPTQKAPPFADSPVFLEYFIPDNLNSLDEFVLLCKLYKGPIDGKGEITQVLPIGFNVLDTAISNARTEFKDYTLSLYWDELPADSIIEISYRVKLDKVYGSLPMTSIVYFNKKGKEQKFTTDVFIKRKIVAEPIAVVDEKPEEKDMSSPSEKVSFELQVRASYKKQLSTDSLKQLFGIDREINEHKIGSWYKYSIGSFKTYQEAREYRKMVIGKKGIKDPCIIAYYEGKRLNSLSELKDIAPESLPGRQSLVPIPKTFEESGRCYRVQMLALMHKQIAPSVLRDIYNIEEEVYEEVSHNWRKYTAGYCLTRTEALKLRQQLVDKGLDGAFVVKYNNGERAISE